jgi:hypothetical protein
MIRTTAKITSILALLQLTAACTIFTSALSPETKPEPGAGYVYGRFTLNESSFGIGHLRMGLVLEDKEKTESYTIQFEWTDSPFVIAVKPGNYALKKFVFASWDYVSEGEKKLPEGPLTKAFVVEPGKAYYIADLVGQSTASFNGFATTHSWRLESVKDDYEKTTADFKNKFQNFREVDFTRAIKLE